ncbi:hypothetical protein GN956_G11531 [Arapaima gigas]
MQHEDRQSMLEDLEEDLSSPVTAVSSPAGANAEDNIQSRAKEARKEDEVLAIYNLHWFHVWSRMENQLKAFDAEFDQLKEHSRSTNSRYIEGLST